VESIRPKTARYEFTAVRDDAGVPHVTGASWQEAIYALGYLHATDRPTQIYFARTVAMGRAAERIANTHELVETDRFFRRAGLYRYLRREAKLLEPRIREQLTWYCEGVNDGITDAGRTLAMWVTGFRPQPWDVEAVLLIGNLLSFSGLAVGQQDNERLLLELVQLGIEASRIRELFSPHLDDIDLDVLREIKMARRLSDDALELIADLPRLAGSNAWAVAPARSASGHALLASDPHLEINRLPAIWYEVALSWGAGEYAMGATLPGCPLMAVGRTRRLAWGVTYLHGDTSDHFIEDCREGGATGWQYRRGETWHDFSIRQEQVARKGAEPQTLRIFENDTGTLQEDPAAFGPGKYLSVAWIGHGEGAGRSIGVWLDVIASPSAQAAMDVVRETPHPSLVWVFADVEGHIGRQASGWFPRRSEIHSGLVPVPAWDERNLWFGRIDSRALPRRYDPPEEFISSANENINQPFGPRFTTHPLPDYRKRRIDEVLARLTAARPKDMQALQYDVYSTHARDILPAFLVHIPDGDLKDRLTGWDLRYTPHSREATLFQSLYRHVVLEIFGHEEGIGWRRMFFLSTRMGYSTMVLTCVDRILRKDRSSWWQVRDKGEMIRRAAARAASEPQSPWSKINSFHFVNRFFENSRAGRMLGFRTARMPLAGCHATPFQGHLLMTATRESTFAPSYHFVTDLGTDEAWTNLPGGPSESRFSKWYKTDIPRWAAGEYKVLRPGVNGEAGRQ
jgi:penicillin amidase